MPSSTKLATTTFWKLFLSYPTGVYFCLLNESAERFVRFGYVAIMTFYLMSMFSLSSHSAMIAFHAFGCVTYLTPVLGSILADGFFGAYKIVIVGTVFYIAGTGFLMISSLKLSWFDQTGHKLFGMCGLAALALGTGVRKPCLAALAADQFSDNMVDAEQKQFFSILYLGTYASGVLTQFLTPFFRGGVQCQGQQTCYPLAFGVLTLVILLSLVILLAGNSTYKKRHVTSNVLLEAWKCIFHAFGQKLKKSHQNHIHWLDRANDKYPEVFIADLKHALMICLVLTPTVVTWAMIFQTGSSFVIQGSFMNGHIRNMTILPDQMITTASIFVVLLIISLESYIYPALARKNMMQSPLQRIGFSCILAILAFSISGFIQLELDNNLAINQSISSSDNVSKLNLNNFSSEQSLSYVDYNATLLQPNIQLSILWQIPQYCLIYSADLFLSTGGVEFAYTQAAPSLKSSLQAYRLATLSMGHLVYTLVASLGLVTRPASVFFFWPIVLALVMVVYVILARNYRFLESNPITIEKF